MFTGIVDHCGEITQITPMANGLQVMIKTQFSELVLGESIAINGCCVTVTDHQAPYFSCELSPETLKLTTAETLGVGDLVNLERSLAVGDRLGGHFVAGHVDQIAKVAGLEQQAEFTAVTFHAINEQYQALLTSKGSITVNGVSLTINSVDTLGFSVMLIPHTWERTNLHTLKPGSLVNIEFDLMAKLVAEQVKRYMKTAA